MIFMMLVQLVLAIVHGSSRDITVGGPVLSFSGKQISQNLSGRRPPQLIPATLQGGVGSRCQPPRAVVRAVNATKHKPGLSPSYRVVSYGSAVEVWALLTRPLSHYMRARGATFAVVPHWRADPQWRQARPQQFTDVRCAKNSALLLSIFHETRELACGQATFESTAKDIISARISFPARAAIVPLVDWLPARAILRTPTRLVTTLHSLL